MAVHKRTLNSITEQNDIGTGPYLARIVSHLDPTFMGSLEVILLRQQGNSPGQDSQSYIVRGASPFYGYTAYEFMGENTATKFRSSARTTGNETPLSSTIEAFNDTQKSYGMWMVPPDIGVQVLVVFVDGDPSQGYWIACVPSKFTNNMVPAIGASTAVDMDPADKLKYNTTQVSKTPMPLPVAEINRRLNTKEAQETDAEKIRKPLHPIAERFLEQGLLIDDARGTTTTSSRREAPSMVFGISTPGPLDKRPQAKRAHVGTANNISPTPVPVSRLGGTQFVMDDGDDKLQRATPAGVGPVKYASVLNGEKGDPTIPYNEYFRVRTRTGHQLLMHNSEDLIYIGNSRGTTWIELTSNGKIDIYAQDSISIHTENDLNIKADRDINMEAGRNINFRAETGRWHAEVATNLEFLVNADAKITVGANFDLLVGDNTKISSHANFDLASNGNNTFSAGGNTDIGSIGNHTESADKIFMNSIAAIPAEVATFVQPLDLRVNAATSTSAGWDKLYQAGIVNSIMKRIPMHEPWLQHENQAPNLQTPQYTDREKGSA